MTEEALDTTVDLISLVLWVSGGVVAGLIVSYLVTGLVRVFARRYPVAAIIVRRGRRPFQAILVVLGAWLGLVLAVPLVPGIAEPSWRRLSQHALLILLILAATWFVAQMVRVLEDAALEHIRARGDEESGRAKRVQTQAQVLRRVGFAVVVILGMGAVLLTFPGARAAGASILASAGIVSVVAGLAAQSTLGNIFAGLQLAFTDAIRVDDIVIVEKQFGHIEEITLTYVVVRLWDDRRMIMPSTYFTTTPFENWTRQAPALLGTVEIDVDWRVPVPAMRAELNRLLASTDMWDGRVGVFQVHDAVGGYVRVRALFSGKDAPTVTDLKYYVREHLVDWLQTNAPYALPRQRMEEDVVEVIDDRGSEEFREVAEELNELADLDAVPEPVDDTILMMAAAEEDPEERRRRAAAARKARRRAEREDRRRAREHGGLLGRASEEARPQPSGEATQVMDPRALAAELARKDATPDGSAPASAAQPTPSSNAAPSAGKARPRRTSIRQRLDVDGGPTPAPGHEASVFSGSKDAEERARAFSGPTPEALRERQDTAERRRTEEQAPAELPGVEKQVRAAHLDAVDEHARTAQLPPVDDGNPAPSRADELRGKDASPDSDGA